MWAALTSGSDLDWQADLARCDSARPMLQEQSLWAIWVYRFGRRVDRMASGSRKRLLLRVYWFMFRVVEMITGISIPKACQIGPGLRIWHFGGIFLHPEVMIGANCTLRHGVTIGNRHIGGGVPTLGDNVELGAYAQVFGPVRLGDGCRVGALSLVLADVPDGAAAVGIPARIVLGRDLGV
jgi:serine O-acetyltransferase